eukprot:CAMPEP_0180138544 /NCGR_PEP_ID=MMETSP0986-20121125/12967_1 /TAXON_ID=697907 /ORGANISM="non described non described, Strain CCMP2293" /LENGTH=82 /DNA_ID=CAMNT_0022080409 /DNA_START=759 /DNA_END=1007 /DNA_ORIENTATION=-
MRLPLRDELEPTSYHPGPGSAMPSCRRGGAPDIEAPPLEYPAFSTGVYVPGPGPRTTATVSRIFLVNDTPRAVLSPSAFSML